MKLLRWVTLGFLLCLSSLSAATIVQNANSSSQLLSEYTTVQPGAMLQTMLHIKTRPGWHVYWENPGDAGEPPNVQWQIPDFLQPQPIKYLVPTTFHQGPLVSYGYSGDAYYIIPIQVTQHARPGHYTLKAHAQWLICEAECIPEQANFTLPLTIGSDSISSSDAEAIYQAIAKLPASHQGLHYQVDGSSLDIILPPSLVNDRTTALNFLPVNEGIIDRSQSVKRVQSDGVWHAHITMLPGVTIQPPLRGLLTIKQQNGSSSHVMITAQPANHTRPAGYGSLAIALLFAFVGGIILNLMPCVFPILALKALSITQHTDHHRRMALLYTVGVLVTFTLISTLLILLKLSGQAVGWGFQLQSPWVIGLLVYLFFIMGLCLSGYFEFGTQWMGMGSQLTKGNGYLAHFFTGVLAVVVASPCTAPLMAPALGYAFTQPWPITLGITLALGLGFACPILAVSFIPGLARRLPRPGNWMSVFKQLMGFLLFASCIWLLWVLMQQVSYTMVMAILAGLLMITIALWFYRSCHRQPWRFLIPLLLMLLALWPVTQVNQAASSVSTSAMPQDATPFSPQALQQALQSHDITFVNATAAWCITCKVNEVVALSQASVHEAMQRYRVKYLVADWTNRNETIQHYLQSFGRQGVPLYVVYNKEGKARVLPQVLTSGIIIDAFKQAAKES